MKKSISWILCLSIILSTFLCPLPRAFAVEKNLHIEYDGSQVNELTIRQNEKLILTAKATGMKKVAYQWQLLLDVEHSVWVDIYDKTEPECEISYAVLNNLLDETGNTYIRCSGSADGNVFYSEAVSLTVTPTYEIEGQPVSAAKTMQKRLTAPKAVSTKVASNDDTTEYVNIIIKYLDASAPEGKEAAIYSPYTAVIERGSNFNQNIISPTFLGFAPFYDADGDGLYDNDATTVPLNLTNITENVEIKVFYEPIEVNFAIRYFFQNIYDDLYTENVRQYHVGKAKTGTIIEDSYLREHAGDTTGFEKMFHIPETVAADGSTVFECYYDRNYYLIQFELNGGYGVDPVYARYETPFVINEPVKSGYVFAGWDRMYDTDNDGVFDTGDGIADEIGSTIGTENMMYSALWESVETTYTRAYWAIKDDGSREYLGAIRTPATSGDTVSGSDDMIDRYEEIFPFEEHTHSEEAGCYGNCPYKDHVHTQACSTLICGNETHTHTLACYTQEGQLTAAETEAANNNNVETAFNSLKNAVSTPVNGYIYRYGIRQGWGSTTRHNFFYYDGQWYYLGTGNNYDGIEHNTISNPSANAYTSVAANTICGKTAHTHTDACYNFTCEASSHIHTDACISCQKLVHVHDETCNPNPRYYEYYDAGTDKNVVIEGDGSSIVNITYRPKKYTLRFYYARSSGSGTNIKYEVVGGSTYPFGGYGVTNPENATVPELLASINAGSWGGVVSLPEFYPNNSDTVVNPDNFTLGSYAHENGYTYYYFDFSARYGQDIHEKWPCGILAPVQTSETHATTGYKSAYFSAWNGEYKVNYTQTHLESNGGNGNLTIKGRQMILDERLLYDGQFEDSSVVSFLAFWENGVDVSWSVPKMYRYHIMLEAPNNTVTEHTFTYDGSTMYFNEDQVFRTFDDSGLETQTATDIPGFTFITRSESVIENGFFSEIGQEQIATAYEVYFWYRRNDYTLTYFNYENVITAEFVEYEKLFTAEEFDRRFDRYPPSLEPNAYQFVGWYTSPLRIYPIEFDKETMPAENIVWYAKWIPVKHKVGFFTTYDEMLAYENGDTSIQPFKSYSAIDHGSIVGSVENPVRTGDGDINLIFAGWFYMENGEKKAFSPLNMPVNRDLNVFADWSSSSPQPYHLQYVLLDDPNIKIADDTSGFAYAGSTRTFSAKAGDPYNQLYSEYNKGYYPTIASHSITMQYEEDKDHPASNVATFYYVYATDIEYTVRYVNRETNMVMSEEVKTTSNSVVTERFKAYPNMVPDAFYKRLVLAVEFDEELNKYVGSKENVITFYYTPNTISAYYAVHFMLQKADATDAEKQNFAIDGSGGYKESSSYFEGTGTIGSSVSVLPQEFLGFALIPDAAISVAQEVQRNVSQVDGQYTITVTESGTELYLFYERLQYNYLVHYYVYNSTEKLAADKNGTGMYDSTVTEMAPQIAGYSCVSSQTQTITIRSEDDPNNVVQNIIIFYYAPIQYVAEYVAVPPDGGLLTNTIEVISGSESLSGSAPTANAYYQFNGWYLDEACTQSAVAYGDIDPATNRFIPNKSMLKETARNIFYAKFTRSASGLTIVRNQAANDGQVFVYSVKNNDTGEAITVTVVGNNSVTIKNLPFGSYTVTQENNWSWRYSDSAIVADHRGTGGTTVQFSENLATNKWLNGNSARIQNQRGKPI